MASFDFRDLVSGMEVRDPSLGSVPVLDIMREHLVRYVMTTSKGIIILRHMPLRVRRQIDLAQARLYPSRLQMEAEARMLLPYFDGVPPEQVRKDKLDRFEQIAHQLMLTDMSAMGVIVAPALGSMEDYERLFDSLTPEEQVQLATAVRDLATPVPPEKVDSTALEIARANGLQVMDEDMLQMLTVSQAAYWSDRVARESRKAEEMARAIAGRKA